MALAPYTPFDVAEHLEDLVSPETPPRGEVDALLWDIVERDIYAVLLMPN
jgi:hypothetical protein